MTFSSTERIYPRSVSPYLAIISTDHLILLFPVRSSRLSRRCSAILSRPPRHLPTRPARRLAPRAEHRCQQILVAVPLSDGTRRHGLLLLEPTATVPATGAGNKCVDLVDADHDLAVSLCLLHESAAAQHPSPAPRPHGHPPLAAPRHTSVCGLCRGGDYHLPRRAGYFSGHLSNPRCVSSANQSSRVSSIFLFFLELNLNEFLFSSLPV